MYVLPQTGILANELLQRNLAKDGYRPTQHTHGLWTHNTRPISFSLVVDDFGVKYVGREHAEHSMACIKKNYNISSDWNGHCKTNPTPATPRARPHGRTDKCKRPESHPTKECARACVRFLNTEPNYYYCPITLVMS
jgi:hypothetical protein